MTGPDGSIQNLRPADSVRAPAAAHTARATTTVPMVADGRWSGVCPREVRGNAQLRPCRSSAADAGLTNSAASGYYDSDARMCPDSSCVVVPIAWRGGPTDLFAVSLDSGERRNSRIPRFATATRDLPDGTWMVFRREVAPFAGEVWCPPADMQWMASRAGLKSTDMTLRKTRGRRTHGDRIQSKESLGRSAFPDDGMPARLPFVGEDGQTPIVSSQGPARGAPCLRPS